jgi:hypothetical protein
MSDGFLLRQCEKVNNVMRLPLLEHILACKLSKFYMQNLTGKHLCNIICEKFKL